MRILKKSTIRKHKRIDRVSGNNKFLLFSKTGLSNIWNKSTGILPAAEKISWRKISRRNSSSVCIWNTKTTNKDRRTKVIRKTKI